MDDQVLVEELKRCDSLMQFATRSYDVETLDKLLPEDFTLISSSGRLFRKGDVLAETADRKIIWYNNDTSNVDIRVYNGNCGIVVAELHQKFEQDGKIIEVRLRYTDTWVLAAGEWSYVSGHATRLH